MSKLGSTKHVFPGANTPDGFYSLYDHIAAVDANRIFVIKGGPGTGKSTFMKKIANDLHSRGIEVEYHHCSADNNSIDAIYIPAADVAVLDGTAPHVIDPKNPGAVDEIIHLGDYWDETAMRSSSNREAILRTNWECNFRFKRANDARKAAKAYLEEWKAYYTACLDLGGLNTLTDDLIADILPQRTGRTGAARRLFASAITYDGPKHWLEELFSGSVRRIVLKGEPGTGKSTLMERLADTALTRGYSLDVYHCPMHPEEIDHVLVRDVDTAVITSHWPHEFNIREGDSEIDLNSYADVQKLAGWFDDIQAAKAGFHAAIQREIHHLGKAKQAHDELESYYIPNMNYVAIEERRVRTLTRILALIAERQPVTAD